MCVFNVRLYCASLMCVLNVRPIMDALSVRLWCVSSICILYMYPLYVSSICIFYMYPRCARVSLIVIVFFSLVRPWKQKIMINVPKIRDIYILNIQNRHILIIYILKFKQLNQVRRWRVADLQTNLSYFVNILSFKIKYVIKIPDFRQKLWIIIHHIYRILIVFIQTHTLGEGRTP